MTDGVTLTLPWGRQQMELALPEEWRVAAVLEPKAVAAVADMRMEMERSLSAPLGCGRLRDLVRPGMRVAILIDDDSRPTPVALILPAILNELARGGVTPATVSLVTALGVHRPMRPDEIARRVGSEVFEQVRWENHDCDDHQRLVFLGTTQRGTPVWLNRTLLESDLVVSVGCIEPHVIAGFGGGYKNVLPGAAGRSTVARNHALNCVPEYCNMAGQPLERNPMRLDLEEGAQRLPRPVFIVNAVLNAAQAVVRIVCGDPIVAHRAGVQACTAVCAVPVSTPADIVIANSHPLDHDLRQGVKALANTLLAVRPGGVHLTLVHAREGIGGFALARRLPPLARHAPPIVGRLVAAMLPRLRMVGWGEEDRFFLYFALRALTRAALLLYAPSVPAEVRRRLPFARFADSPADAIAAARRRFPHRASVLVFPHGGTTYPVIAPAVLPARSTA